MKKKTFEDRQKKRSGKPSLKARQKQNRVKEQIQTAKKRADFFNKLDQKPTKVEIKVEGEVVAEGEVNA